MEFCERCTTEAGTHAITVANIRSAIVLIEPAHVETAEWFCCFLLRLPHHLKSAGCDLLSEAAAIPVLFDQLRRWPADAVIMRNACIALFNLALFGSAAVKSLMRSVPDCESLLRLAQTSGLDVWDGRGWAALVLTTLGF